MVSTKKLVISLCIIGLIVLGVVALINIFDTNQANGNVVKESSKSPIKLGASLPLTGEGASYGAGGLAGAELAVKEINDAGGINGRKIELVVEDDQCNNKGGINALTKLANVDEVVAIIGPVCSAAAGPGLPVVEAKGIPIIIWGTAPSLPVGKEFVFRTTPSDSFAGRFTAEYVYNELNKRKVAVAYVQNDWGQGLRDVFVKRFKELGGEIVFDEGVSQEAKDMRSTVTKIANAKPDAIYFPAYPGIAIVGLKQMKEQGISVPIIAGDAFETDEVIKSGVADGVMYVVVSIKNPEEFQARAKAVSNKQTNIITPMAYDSVKIFAEIIEDVGTNPIAIKDALKKYKTTKAVSLPEISFDAEGDLASAVFDVKVIEGGKTKVVD